MKSFRVFFLITLVIFSISFLQVARCTDPVPPKETAKPEDSGEIGLASDATDESQDLGDGAYGRDSFSPAPGIETICIFPKNPSKLILAGEPSELLVGLKNDGESSVNVIAVQAAIHLPVDHRYLVQNLSAQAFNKAAVPPSAHATFPYMFAVSKFLQPGSFDLVGTIVYEIDKLPYQNTFFNGTIEVAEAGGLYSVETVFLFCLGVGLLTLLGFWVSSQTKQLSKKTKRAPKVEVGTATTDASMDEWLQGTAYSAQGSKQKKRK